MNPRLFDAIAAAKRAQLSKQAIGHAIARGQGKTLSGQVLENVLIEAMLPHGVAAMMECETDNKARTLTAIRTIINKAGGTVTPTAFLFEKKGRINFEKQEAMTLEHAMEDAIEAGALDIDLEDGQLVVETEPNDVMAVARKLQGKLNLQIGKAEVIFIPNEDSLVTLSDKHETEVQGVIDALEQEPTLQNIYLNAA
jgi:transcriptional/translational regulatory protein YebC/TACO1